VEEPQNLSKMPFARHSGYSFSIASVGKNAPACGGVYGLSNAQGWIYINAAENIQAALLNHLIELNRVSEFQTATGFTFELCDCGQRAERRDRLIVELHPLLNESSKRK
jgi:hypothetical protein